MKALKNSKRSPGKCWAHWIIQASVDRTSYPPESPQERRGQYVETRTWSATKGANLKAMPHAKIFAHLLDLVYFNTRTLHWMFFSLQVARPPLMFCAGYGAGPGSTAGDAKVDKYSPSADRFLISRPTALQGWRTHPTLSKRLFDSQLYPYKAAPLLARVDMGIRMVKGYLTLPKTIQKSPNSSPIIRCNLASCQEDKK